MLIVVAAVVVVVVLVVALFASGVISIGRSSSSSGASATYLSAASPADNYAAGVPGGPWNLVEALGWNIELPYSNASSYSGCDLTGGSGGISIPAHSGNYSDGSVSAWGFAYVNTARTSVLLLEYANGGVTEIGSGANSTACPLGLLPPLPAAGIQDSSTVSTTFLSSPAVAAFVATHQSANATYVLVASPSSSGGGLVYTPLWVLDYSTCSATPGTGPSIGTTVEGFVNATSGALEGGVYNTSMFDCPYSAPSSTAPLGTEFAWGVPTNATGQAFAQCPETQGEYCYTVEVAGASSSVTTSDISLALRNSAGATVAWPSGILVSLVAPTSPDTVATYSTSSESWIDNSTFSGGLEGGDTVVLYSPSGLLGDELVAVGEHSLTGDVPSNAFS